ncbi:hypothetical protein [Ornithinimicrobium cerasi]|uniref:hypothetical protein n=1 Tax=Ornithinimicrobium cerasi TaxID=2248773 RepID=UPI000F00AFC9|nr:hypothetical protein [Ornithinimicrobium cerasi]
MTSAVAGRPRTGLAARSVLAWSVPISLLVLVCSVAGLTDPRVYAQETVNWATQARGQDVGNLVAVVVLLAAAVRHAHGSMRAGLVWLGALLYLVYAFVVYAMAVHLNYLFLAYVAVLGLSAWALVVHVGPLRSGGFDFPHRTWTRVAAGVSVGTGVLFAALWLGELVPAAVTGTVPDSLTEAGLWVNPIHVIDLSIVLPALVVTGVGAWLGRPGGLFWLGPWLVFSALMGASIVVAMLLMLGTEGAAAIPPAVMVSFLVAVSVGAVTAYLRRVREVGVRTVAGHPARSRSSSAGPGPVR